ncbi:MAG: ATP-binding protein [Pirellula sp.]|jgi:two-component system sensor histidine kinase RegB|nr:ATP-binding protein [Pirellula sp.]
MNRHQHSIVVPYVSTAIWLTQLRWVAVVGQLLVVGSVTLLLKIPLQWVPLLLLISWTAVTNLAMTYWVRRIKWSLITKSEAGLEGVEKKDRSASDSFLDENIGNRVLTAVLSMDVATLTALLYFTGGAANPFLIFYFANIAIAGMLLPRRLAWVITGISITGCVFLLQDSREITELAISSLAARAPWGIEKVSFLIAFMTCSSVVTYFVTMLAVELRQREIQLAVIEKERERARRLEAMATLAAGAGHELATPLSTIAVVANELSRNLEKYEVSQGIRRDVKLIREELNRCKEILHRMKSGAGEAAAENLKPITLQELVKATVEAMREPNRVIVSMDEKTGDSSGVLPKQAISQALRNLLQNGLDASEPHQKVELQISWAADPHTGEGIWKMTIRDRGTGLSEEVARRIGEPFFTTKEVGKGMGLGVFLTRNVIQGVGGAIYFEQATGGGTVCRVDIPCRN